MNASPSQEQPIQTPTIAVSATFTAEPLQEALDFWLAELAFEANILFAPFAQVFQELLAPDSLLASNSSGLNVILVRPSDWDTQDDSFEHYASKFVSALGAVTTQSSAMWLICICHDTPSKGTNTYEKLLSELRMLDSIQVITPDDVERLYPVETYHDAEQDKLACIPYTSLYYTSLATLIMRRFYAMITPDIKVIALDCDNTLWRGVCGEVGAHGVEVDSACHALQDFMLEQHQAGVLLCLCSKNNEQDVLDVFAQHSDMPLSLDDIVATRVNWKPKSDNLKSLSDELGLGLDSFVFVDDDAVECSEVNTRCPEVTTLQLPRQRPLIARFLHHVWAFDHSDTTDEARMRNALYRQNAQRQTAATQALTLQDFLHDLNLSVSIERMNDDHIPRVAELFNRTNQFNATTQRYSSGEVRALLQSGQQQVLVTSAQDRFGDYGLIGVAVYGIDGDTLDVRSLLLSCRALGKRIEHQVIQRLTNIAIDAGCQWLQVRYVKNEKNHLVVGFLEQLGEHSTATQEQALLYRFRIQSLSVEV